MPLQTNYETQENTGIWHAAEVLQSHGTDLTVELVAGGLGELVLGAPSMNAGTLPALLAFTPLPLEFIPAKGTGDDKAAGAAAANGEAAAEGAGAMLLAALGGCVLKAEVRVSMSATPWEA